ncbi:hypothetical protein R1flu_022052 [Riccia fluitans]|uniref:Uncharacterized protein n=1 Tax=Riccia fluitans TaxID=41844 RepID=A0ABD1ZR60_9MARC
MTTVVKRIKPERPDSKNFLSYGQIISPKQDGGVYDEEDAQLDLTHGIHSLHLRIRISAAEFMKKKIWRFGSFVFCC